MKTRCSRKGYQILSWTAVILWMMLIFHLSHQPASQSNELSTGITEVIIETIEKVVPHAEFDLRDLNHLIRKNAHFFTYLVLGALVINALSRSGSQGWKGVVLAFALCVLYAVSDEIHQLYVPGRGAQVKDVLIDSAGSAAGIGVWLGTRYIIGKMLAKRRGMTESRR